MWLFRITLVVCRTILVMRLITYYEEYQNERSKYMKKGREYYQKKRKW